MWIPRTGTDFCLQLCLSLWYGFCHALAVILVCLFAVSCFSGRNFGQTCCFVIWLPPEHKSLKVLAEISASLSEWYLYTVV